MSLRRYIRASLPTSPAPRSFAFLSLLLGSLYAAFNPPFAVNDERDHWLRVVEITTGRFMTRCDAEGPYYLLPKDHRKLMSRYGFVQREARSRVDADLLLQDLKTPGEEPPKWMRRDAGASGYSPVPYLPHILPVWAARALRLPPLWQIYLARCSSLACYALITAWSVALAGRLGWVFFALGLMPMSLTQAAGLSGDGMALAASFSFFALIAKGAFGPTPLSRRELGLLLVWCAVLPLCRPPYLLFTGALVALRWEGNKAQLRRWLYAAAGCVLAASALAAWMYANRTAATSGSDVLGDQLAWIAEHPGKALLVLLNTAVARGDDYLIQFVAVRDVVHRQMRFLGGLMAGFYLSLLAAVTAGASRSPRTPARSLRWPAASIALAGVATSGAVVLAMYLAATEIGATVISGVQGRYFIPVAPAFLLPLSTCGSPTLGNWLSRRSGRRLKFAIVASNLTTVLALLARYYGSSSTAWPY